MLALSPSKKYFQRVTMQGFFKENNRKNTGLKKLNLIMSSNLLYD